MSTPALQLGDRNIVIMQADVMVIKARMLLAHLLSKGPLLAAHLDDHGMDSGSPTTTAIHDLAPSLGIRDQLAVSLAVLWVPRRHPRQISMQA